MALYLMQATDEQLQKLLDFLDVVLKKDGISSLASVVDIYNIVSSATKLEEKSPFTQQETEEEKQNG